MQHLIYSVLASTYGAGAYNTSNYNGTSAGGASTLANTGIAVLAIVSAAALILLLAIVVRIWKRPSKKTSDESAE